MFRGVFRRLGLLFAALALFSMAGGHWAVLQSVAWANMLHDYAGRTGSIALAVEQTFDGQHPCALCREITAAKAGDHQKNPVSSKTKDDAKLKALVAEPLLRPLVWSVAKVCFPPAVSDFFAGRTEPPPTPPPRRTTLSV